MDAHGVDRGGGHRSRLAGERYRRTGDKGCLGHFSVAGGEVAPQQQVVDRLGIVVFVVGVVAGVPA